MVTIYLSYPIHLFLSLSLSSPQPFSHLFCLLVSGISDLILEEHVSFHKLCPIFVLETTSFPNCHADNGCPYLCVCYYHLIEHKTPKEGHRNQIRGRGNNPKQGEVKQPPHTPKKNCTIIRIPYLTKFKQTCSIFCFTFLKIFQKL